MPRFIALSKKLMLLKTAVTNNFNDIESSIDVTNGYVCRGDSGNLVIR